MNRLEKFIEFIKEHEEEGGFIGVLMNLPNQDRPELIVNIPESLTIKTNYYLKAYNPDLTLKTNSDVKIVGYSWVKDFEMLGTLFEEEI